MQRLSKIKLFRVHYIPKTLEPGILYVSEEFGASVHLCACGCGSKVSTPIGPTDWALEDTPAGPTLAPSVGNWQLPCKSHYWIREGQVMWAGAWSHEQVIAGRREEERRHRAYFASRAPQRSGILQRFWRWLIRLFSWRQ
jgi:hypothetical protein